MAEMSEKMTCPGCDSHTSSVLRAYEDGAGCPYCNLPWRATNDLIAARNRNADQQLTLRLKQLSISEAEWKQRAETAERKLADIRYTLGDET